MRVKGEENRKSPGKPADQRHRAARFPHAGIRARPLRGNEPGLALIVEKAYHTNKPKNKTCLHSVVARPLPPAVYSFRSFTSGGKLVLAHCCTCSVHAAGVSNHRAALRKQECILTNRKRAARDPLHAVEALPTRVGANRFAILLPQGDDESAVERVTRLRGSELSTLTNIAPRAARPDTSRYHSPPIHLSLDFLSRPSSETDKGDTATCIKCAIAAKRKPLNWHAAF
ncbi:hypothetical protein PR048_032378 [Dryococelus australis]|uniref:Uncharacterized protein n=1 Tax=Dryococelus australis TaxID=614101 RepID=A0ABQ9G231_9NEOP|nr:hypothetical protein PR048_032378 [Dryococelus australis]